MITNSSSSTDTTSENTVLYLNFDFDGSMAHGEYYKAREFQVKSEKALLSDQKIIEINQIIFDYIGQVLKDNPKIKIIHIGNFSLRQGDYLNKFNSRENNNESCFVAKQKYVAHIKSKFPNCLVELEQLLFPDIENCRKHGTAFQYALKNNYVLDSELTEEQQEEFDTHNGTSPGLTSKRDLFFMHLQNAAITFPGEQILMITFEDLIEKVLDPIKQTFSSEKAKIEMPSNVSSILMHYQDGILTEHSRLNFNGRVNRIYDFQLRFLWQEKSKEQREAMFEKVLGNELKAKVETGRHDRGFYRPSASRPAPIETPDGDLNSPYRSLGTSLTPITEE